MGKTFGISYLNCYKLLSINNILTFLYFLLFYLISKDNDSQPKVQEIIFNRASSNQPASMTWRYPEPRALTKIEVSPVPFQCEEGKHSKDRQV